jgi:hypothetical protein
MYKYVLPLLRLRAHIAPQGVFCYHDVMAKKKHTNIQQTFHARITDAAVALGLVALSAELALMTLVGSGMQGASVYTPLPFKPAALENRFDRQIDTTIIKSPKANNISACERRSVRIKNQKRRDQFLALCHARQKNTQNQD